MGDDGEETDYGYVANKLSGWHFPSVLPRAPTFDVHALPLTRLVHATKNDAKIPDASISPSPRARSAIGLTLLSLLCGWQLT